MQLPIRDLERGDALMVPVTPAIAVFNRNHIGDLCFRQLQVSYIGRFVKDWNAENLENVKGRNP